MMARPLPIRPPRPISHQRWIEIREQETNHLLFKYDPLNRLVEIQRRRRKTVVDLERLDSAKNRLLTKVSL